MAAVKKLNTTYTLDTTDVYLTGNLHVAGVYDTVTVTNTDVADRTIALNVGEGSWGVGGNASPGTSGIIVDRGLAANVSLRWNESYDKWELTTDGAIYSNLATGSFSLISDPTPTLGGNLVTNGFHIQFDDTAILPSAVPNAVQLGAGTPGSAGSGLIVINSLGADELVTKTKAIVYSIIL